MKRILFNLATLLSFLICAAAVAFWIDSIGKSVRIHHASWTDLPPQSNCLAFNLSAIDGTVCLGYEQDVFHTQKLAALVKPASQAGFHYTAFAFDRKDFDPLGEHGRNWAIGRSPFSNAAYSEHGFRILFKAWALVAISGVLPILWIFRTIRRRKRVKVGQCRVCGYDLRASPERCPECGTVAVGATGS